ncbi:uncharacterized protein LY79DRAFT_554933 [Colletotrichum navitas]|uniref:Uncharacterized protein n=1 Tax=Colletotrichum navitas TaxID=681940 RepID=A0AAD8PZ89_9PEZI|nr:uncharacterized protein LY79DRAFT_554933 [Colletotrichum navitas]KAK1590289.1 hypothetical protein LY79DRAFT_554933 [Colletotrichum navitas]
MSSPRGACRLPCHSTCGPTAPWPHWLSRSLPQTPRCCRHKAGLSCYTRTLGTRRTHLALTTRRQRSPLFLVNDLESVVLGNSTAGAILAAISAEAVNGDIHMADRTTALSDTDIAKDKTLGDTKFVVGCCDST